MQNKSPDTGETARKSLQAHQNIICCAYSIKAKVADLCSFIGYMSTNFREAVKQIRNVCSVIEGIDQTEAMFNHDQSSQKIDFESECSCIGLLVTVNCTNIVFQGVLS